MDSLHSYNLDQHTTFNCLVRPVRAVWHCITVPPLGNALSVATAEWVWGTCRLWNWTTDIMLTNKNEWLCVNNSISLLYIKMYLRGNRMIPFMSNWNGCVVIWIPYFPLKVLRELLGKCQVFVAYSWLGLLWQLIGICLRRGYGRWMVWICQGLK